jgi:CheY-like chemotaxis protein
MTIKTINMVLLVEDNGGDARLLGEMLKDQGMQGTKVIHAQSMSDAQKQLAQHVFDIALLDLELPDAHGLEMVLWIRKIAPRIPVVVLTGTDDDGLPHKRCKRARRTTLLKVK